MYAWVFGIDGFCYLGRTWEEFLDVLHEIRDFYELSDKKRLIVYCHNLCYEFQFMRHWLQWEGIFASTERHPLKAMTTLGIEFRDSYILSGMSLGSTADNLKKYKVMKLIGSLDYKLLRHSNTPLSSKEWHYVINDGLSTMCFIQEEIERNGNSIAKIPLTNTGYVRKYLRNCCYHEGRKSHNSTYYKSNSYGIYRAIMDNLTITLDEYLIAKEAFMGGFTHANILNCNVLLSNMGSYDLSSAYPSSICLDRFPMGKGTFAKGKTQEQYMKLVQCYCCIMRVKLKNIRSRWRGDHFLSVSKCREIKNEKQDNGRIIDCEYCETTITDVDFRILEKFYTFDVEIIHLWYYPRGYLPKPFILGVLELYKNKTTLKGVEGQEILYSHSKGMINSAYGCMVTDILSDNFIYENDEWGLKKVDPKEEIEKYNTSKTRFLSYLWGIYVTSWTRFRIASTIEAIGIEDYVYSDTDSVKFLNVEEHEEYFKSFNEHIDQKIKKVSDLYKIPVEMFKPLTKDGKEKVLGYFDREEDMKHFKTLGAKRYMVEYEKPHKMKLSEGKELETPYSLTISGVNKFQAIPEILKKCKKGKTPFDFFYIGYKFDVNECGKLTHTYIDDGIEGEVIDYLGNRAYYCEKSFIHMEETTYKITTKEEYLETIMLDQNERKDIYLL